MVENSASTASLTSLHAQKRAPAQQYLTLDIRTKEGKAYAIPYPYLMSWELDRTPDTDPVLTLTSTTHTVRVIGRNLEVLYERLLGHRLAQIVENDSDFDDPQEPVFVAAIQVDPPPPGRNTP